jgi:excisionase family DNA binding protein
VTVERKYLRAGDIAQLTGASLRTVRRWISASAFPSVKLSGARLVAEAEVERLLSPTSSSIEEDTNDDDK